MRPQCDPKATLRLHQSHPHATLKPYRSGPIPKPEGRDSKEIRNPRSERSYSRWACWLLERLLVRIWDFGLPSDLGFRPSDFTPAGLFQPATSRGSWAGKAVEAEAGGVARLGIELDGAVAAVFEEFDAGQRGAEADVEGAPKAGFVQGGAQAPDGVAETAYGGHAGQQAAIPQDEVCMQVADNGLLDLRQAGADGLLAPEEGQGGRVMAKDQDALAGRQRGEGAANLRQMLGAQPLPLGPLSGQHLGFEHRQGDES